LSGPFYGIISGKGTLLIKNKNSATAEQKQNVVGVRSESGAHVSGADIGNTFFH
jgi:hypothetical protein